MFEFEKTLYAVAGGWRPILVWVISTIILSIVINLVTKKSKVLRVILRLVTGAILGAVLYYWTGLLFWFLMSPFIWLVSTPRTRSR